MVLPTSRLNVQLYLTALLLRYTELKNLQSCNMLSNCNSVSVFARHKFMCSCS